MKTRVHISLEVSNLEASIDFYQKLLMHEPTKVKDDYANFRLDNPALHLALVSRPDRIPENAQGSKNERHFGFELFDEKDLASWKAKVNASGLTARIEEDVVCCYAKANKFWVQDPDGHDWEFWVRQSEADSMYEPKVDATACCAPGL